MLLSSIVLAFYVFLQSAVYLSWFPVADKLLGLVGMAFVVVRILELVFGSLSINVPRLKK